MFPSVTISRWFPTLFQRMRLLRLTNCREQSSLESFIGDELVERKLNRKLILYNNLNSIEFTCKVNEFTCKVNEGFWIQWPIMVGLKTKNNSVMFIQCFCFLYALQFHPIHSSNWGLWTNVFFPRMLNIPSQILLGRLISWHPENILFSFQLYCLRNLRYGHEWW